MSVGGSAASACARAEAKLRHVCDVRWGGGLGRSRRHMTRLTRPVRRRRSSRAVCVIPNSRSGHDRSIHDSRKPPAGPAGRPRTAYRYEKSVVSSASQAVTPLDEPTTSLGYGTPVAVRRGPVRTRPVRRRGLSRNDGQHAGQDALYGPPSALVGFFTPSDSSHDRALLYLYCISPGPPPPVGPPERAALRSPSRALGRSRVRAYWPIP